MKKRTYKRRSKKSQVGMDSVKKGKLVEQIAAMLHKWPGIEVETNVEFPRPGKSRPREIDVLLTRNVGGSEVRIPIECKNEKEPIGIEKIDAFVGKLTALKIPVQLGVYISASRYTIDAIEAAEEFGIRTLILTGLTEDRLSAVVSEAFQSVIYVLAELVQTRVPDEINGGFKFEEIFIFFDREGVPCGLLPDLLYQMWIKGDIPITIGEQEIRLFIPFGWYHKIGGAVQLAIPLICKVRVSGIVLTVPGTASKHTLLNARSKKIEKFGATASFDLPEGEHPVTTFHSEEELQSFLRRSDSMRIAIGRIRLPRIEVQRMYWPPSERTVRTVYGIWQAGLTGELSTTESIDIEGRDLRTVWEPIWDQHPSGRQPNKETD